MPILGDAMFLEKQFEAGKKEVMIDKEQVSSIIRNAKRLKRLSSDILDITRIESQSLKLNQEKFNIKDVIVSCISDIKLQIISNNSEQLSNLDIVYHPKDIFVFADKNRITQVIFNLLSNSLKFTEIGSITVEAALEKDKTKNKDYVVVRVTDSGQGIDPRSYQDCLLNLPPNPLKAPDLVYLFLKALFILILETFGLIITLLVVPHSALEYLRNNKNVKV